MFKNFLITALRLKCSPQTFFPNLVGLSVGIACFLLILSYVQYETSYGTHHEKAVRIFRVLTIGEALGVSSNLVGITLPTMVAAESDTNVMPVPYFVEQHQHEYLCVLNEAVQEAAVEVKMEEVIRENEVSENFSGSKKGSRLRNASKIACVQRASAIGGHFAGTQPHLTNLLGLGYADQANKYNNKKGGNS